MWFLPHDSPDLNPIEKMWSNVKARLRKAAARTTSALITAIGEAHDTVTPSDARNRFNHREYPEPHTDR